jgi:UDP-glucose 4-epimerase
MRVLITGGGGFLGRALVARLTESGHETTSWDLPSRDIREPCPLPARTRHVVHLAGLLGTSELFGHAREAVDVNIGGTVNVLDACHAGEDTGYTGITMPPVFPSIYTATKIAARELERAYHCAYELPVSRVRAFNAYGPGQKHGPGHPKKIIPMFSAAAWAGQPIIIWGDGTQTVDLIHARDLAALLSAAMKLGDDFTVDGGTGQPLTVNQVARMILDITGSQAGVRHLPMRVGEVPVRIAATGEGWDRLGWVPPVFSPQLFAETVESYR